MPPAAPRTPSGNRRGIVQRMTGKVGPLPVWAWALLLLAAGYLVYRATGAGKAAAAPASTTGTADANGVVGDTSGSPPASGQGSSADNLNESILSQLSGLTGQVDALTATIQSTSAFDGTGGDSGSGSLTPNTGEQGPPGPQGPAGPQGPRALPARPSARPPAPARVRYYTYRPGQAPKGSKRQEAPAKGPAGTTLHFKRGAGYFYA